MSYIFDQNTLRGDITGHTGTGSSATTMASRTIILGFEQYEIVLAVTEDNRVLGVVEVRQKKDFRDARQKLASTGYFDMERFVME